MLALHDVHAIDLMTNGTSENHIAGVTAKEALANGVRKVLRRDTAVEKMAKVAIKTVLCSHYILFQIQSSIIRALVVNKVSEMRSTHYSTNSEIVKKVSQKIILL